jgi:glycosyltransferase involved in cell wall biosynthesis
MTMPEVSIIIPTYNRAALIQETLDSVYHQSYTDYEIIVVDNGSHDNTEEVVRKNRYPITFIQLEDSGLPAVARNAGIRAAQGEYIAFLDSDDIWLPDKLASQVRMLKDHQEIGFLSSNASVFCSKTPDRTELFFKNRTIPPRPTLEYLLGDNIVITSTVLVRREILERSGIFSEDRRLRALEDYDLWLRIAALTSLLFEEESRIRYRDDGCSIRTEQTTIDHLRGRAHLYTTFRQFLMDKGVLTPSLQRRVDDRLLENQVLLIFAHWRVSNYPDLIRELMHLINNHHIRIISYLMRRRSRRID